MSKESKKIKTEKTENTKKSGFSSLLWLNISPFNTNLKEMNEGFENLRLNTSASETKLNDFISLDLMEKIDAESSIGKIKQRSKTNNPNYSNEIKEKSVQDDYVDEENSSMNDFSEKDDGDIVHNCDLKVNDDDNNSKDKSFEEEGSQNPILKQIHNSSSSPDTQNSMSNTKKQNMFEIPNNNSGCTNGTNQVPIFSYFGNTGKYLSQTIGANRQGTMTRSNNTLNSVPKNAWGIPIKPSNVNNNNNNNTSANNTNTENTIKTDDINNNFPTPATNNNYTYTSHPYLIDAFNYSNIQKQNSLNNTLMMNPFLHPHNTNPQFPHNINTGMNNVNTMFINSINNNFSNHAFNGRVWYQPNYYNAFNQQNSNFPLFSESKNSINMNNNYSKPININKTKNESPEIVSADTWGSKDLEQTKTDSVDNNVSLTDDNIKTNSKKAGKPEDYVIEMFGRIGWICDQCNNFNYDTRNKCNRCNISKSPKKISKMKRKHELIKQEQQKSIQRTEASNKPKEVDEEKKRKRKEKKGDWTCTKCNNLNFSFRWVCNRCKLNKNESEAISADNGDEIVQENPNWKDNNNNKCGNFNINNGDKVFDNSDINHQG